MFGIRIFRETSIFEIDFEVIIVYYYYIYELLANN